LGVGKKKDGVRALGTDRVIVEQQQLASRAGHHHLRRHTHKSRTEENHSEIA